MTILSLIRKSFAAKVLSITLVLLLLTECIAPHMAFALTSGPSQPEVQSFEPIGTTDMVDPFSGDFTYNIPLMDVDGYPINLSYHSGITMDQEASWVGLGWNINPGVVNRNIRGIPDDFNGTDLVTKESSIRPNQTFRVDLGASLELIGMEANSGNTETDNTQGAISGLSLNFGLGIYYNNYNGMGYSLSAGAQMDVGPMSLGAQMGFDTEQGVDFSPSLSLSAKLKGDYNDNTMLRGGVSMGYNSRQGLRQLTFDASLQRTQRKTEGKGSQMKTQEEQSGGLNGGAGIDFAAPTYIPNVQPGSYSYGITLSAKFGVAAWAMDPTFSGSINYSESGIHQKIRDYRSYGYLYAERSTDDDYGMQDVTREKEGGFSKYRQYLPLSAHAYDVYSVSGQGTGGVFRPHRGNVGTLFDARSENTSWPSFNFTIEAGTGPPPSGKLGGNIKVMWSESHSGVWRAGNNSLQKLTFRGEEMNSTFEPVYFKNAGEKSINDVAYYSRFGNEKPVRVNLTSTVDDALAQPLLVDGDGGSYPLQNGIQRTERDKRNQAITYLTSDLARGFGLERTIRNYKRNAAGGPDYDAGNDLIIGNEISRIANGRKAHHISEVTTLNPDGSRYVYGIPAYNYVHVEKTFNVYDNGVSCSTGLVEYDAGDNSIDNSHGVDHFYTATKLPPYVHSYLLTAVLSPDYIDITGDGPTEDDFGTYTKLNYSQANSQGAPYKWRTPFYDANHNEGFKSDNSAWEKNMDRRDDKGTYLYGEKEVWYLHSIESKNYIAEFFVSPREDGYGVGSENQENPNTSMGAPSYKLDSIKLYSKYELKLKGSNAVPVKVVHFEYSYNLCGGVHNSITGGGKLTLERVWFTYGNSSRGSLNDYEFDYGDLNDPDNNPSYNMKNYDRWGNYKPNNCNGLNNSDFPYVDQDKDALTDIWAGAWHLKSIVLPSGGRIQINYESDDYAYVQNKPAMQMVKILGCNSDTVYNPSDPEIKQLFRNDMLNVDHQHVMFFKMDQPYASRNAVREAYFRDMQYLYYNCLTKLTDGAASERSDYVAGYMEFDSVGVANINDSVGWVAVHLVPIGDRSGGSKIHPVSKAALQYLRVNRPELANPPEQPNFSPSIFDLVGVVVQFFQEIGTMILGFNRARMLSGYSQEIDPDKSWLRLYEPSSFKKGGGSRVSKLEFFDEWDDMTGNQEPVASYGQEYSYTMSDPLSGRTISSGVASYEPTLGGDENPWRLPVKYKEEIAGAPDNDYYVETPLGESYFPSPSVGYRKVEVQNITPPGINRHATGKTVYEFYTAAEFPTLTSNTTLDPELHKPVSLFSFFGLEQEEFATASQGYSIELNDMHGKMKAMWTYSATDEVTPISGTQYFYKTLAGGSAGDLGQSGNKLDNTVTVLQPDGTYSQKVVGEEIEMVVDANEKEEHNYVVGVQVNADGFLAYILPIVIPIIMPEYSSSHNRIKTIVTTKVVNRYGILSKTVAHDNGAMLETENLAWDSETGEVLLTRTQNEYRDHTYNITYPVHWTYDRMGPAYRNAGTPVTFTLNNGVAVDADLARILVPGDELAPISPRASKFGGANEKLWVLDVKRDSISFIYRDGTPPAGRQTWNCRILRSGRRNMQTLPVMTMSSRVNPLSGGEFSDSTFSWSGVIASSGAEYSEDWHFYEPFCPGGEGCQSNQNCVLNDTAAVLYADLVNQLIEQDRLFTNGTATSIWGSNLWPLQFYSLPMSQSILDQNCGNTYATDAVTGTIGGTTYPGLSIQLDLNGSCTYASSWCGGNITLWSVKNIGTAGADFYDDIEYILPLATYCDDDYPQNISDLNPSGTQTTFFVTAIMKDGSEMLLYVTAPCDVPDITVCDEIGNNVCCISDSIVNPYQRNLKGNWRLLRNFVYYDKQNNSFQRTQSLTAANNYNSTNTRTDGAFVNYVPLWRYMQGRGVWQLSSYNVAASPWTWQAMVTLHNPNAEIENKDALNIYSAATFGYLQTMPLAVAQNAMNRQIAYDGFEDYLNAFNNGCKYRAHFMEDSIFIYNLDTANIHSGRFALRIGNGSTISVTRPVRNYAYTQTGASPGLVSIFRYKPWHLIEGFAPLGAGTYNYGSVSKTIDGRYILSYWVKASNLYSMAANPVTLLANGSNLTLTSTGNDQIVEGWKRVERSFTIPAGTTSFRVRINNSSGADMYIDDIRLHPLKATMKTYAYDYITRRLMAQMDENNYATFYEYDEEGNMVRIKRETERGIMTVQESRQNMSQH